MDILSDILGKVKLSSVIYFKSDFSAPWGMDIAEGPFAQFHLVTRGQCLLRTKNKNLQLFAGDIVVFPKGIGHWLADSETSDRKNGRDVVKAIVGCKTMLNGEISATLVCGHFEFDRNFDHPFIRELPDLVHITNGRGTALSWLKNITDLVVSETGNKLAGNELIVNKLGEILFIHTIRAFIQKKEREKGFLAAIIDEKIGKALRAFHKCPGKKWQLTSLAQTAGMSRTSFCNTFKTLVGETPLSYLTNWRMVLAKELLRESSSSVSEISEKVGYKSEAAFNRVFKKKVAQTPLKFRKSAIV